MAQRIFLSYGRGDDDADYHDASKSFTRRLYNSLTAKDFDVWWDREKMPNRGLTFLQEIRDAITPCDKLLVVVGEKGEESDYVRAEWEYARKICLPVIPILRNGDYNLIPKEISLGHAPDFRDLTHYETQLVELLRILNDTSAPLGKLYNVGDLPKGYIERGDDLSEVSKTLRLDVVTPTVITSAQRLAAVYGMGGVGKSTLARALCYDCDLRRTFPDGLIWLTIGKTPDIATRLGDIGALFGDERGEYPDEERGKSRLSQILADKRALLVLDDVWEHKHAETFRTAGMNCRLLITTRSLRLATLLGARNHELDVLSAEQGVELIAARLEQDADAIAHRETLLALVKLLGGHTLAVSLAATQLELEGLQTAPRLLERIQKRRDGDNPFQDLQLDASDKNFNLELSLAESYERLNDEHRRRFRALGVFAVEGTFDAAAAAAVWQDDLDAAESALSELRRGGLLQAEEGRYQQHMLLRSYARALLLRANEAEDALKRHFEHYERLHADYDANIDEMRHPQITADFENVQAALAWGSEHEHRRAAYMTYALEYYMQLHQALTTRRTLLTQGYEAAAKANSSAGQAYTLKALGDLEVREDHYEAARQNYTAALTLFAALHERLGQAYTQTALGLLEHREDHYDAARQHYSDALALFEVIHSKGGQADTLRALGDLEVMETHYDAARRSYDAALVLYEAIPWRLGNANTLRALGDLERRESHYEAARQRYKAALVLYEAILDRLGQANTLKVLGDLEYVENHDETARQHYMAALTLYEIIPERLGQANTLRALGDLEVMGVHYEAARQRYEAALVLYEAILDRLGRANTLKVLGDLEAKEARYEAARQYYTAALTLYEAIPSHLGQANTLQALGDLECMEMHYEEARQRYGDTLTLARRIPDLPCILNSLIGLARLEKALDNRSAAYDYFHQLFTLTDEHPMYSRHPIVQEWHKEYQTLGRKRSVMGLLRRALKCQKERK